MHPGSLSIILSNIMGGTFLRLVSLLAMTLGLPLLGVTLWGKGVSDYLEFPPKTVPLESASFSWAAFALYSLFILALITPLLRHSLKRTDTRLQHRNLKPFPWWGYMGMILGGAFWVLAWTRFPWFSLFQPFTFTPLWVSYIVCMNALAFRRKGRCLLLDHSFRFVGLFPVSAAFWWIFEYLNRFVGNWYYAGVEFGPTEYFLYASLSFSTVLPAFASTREWVSSFHSLEGFGNFLRLRISRPDRLAFLVLLAAATGLFLLGVYPEYLFPLLWISPLLILVSLQALMKETHVFSPLGNGNWHVVITSAVAALVCGFFWEMWNYYSLAKWAYRVPLVQHLPLFEMPLLGYAGYLPFGVECAVVVEMVLGQRK